MCLTTAENNALTTIVPVTHLNARTPLVLVPSRRVHVPPFCLQLARLCAAQCSVVCSSARLCGGSPVISNEAKETGKAGKSIYMSWDIILALHASAVAVHVESHVIKPFIQSLRASLCHKTIHSVFAGAFLDHTIELLSLQVQGQGNQQRGKTHNISWCLNSALLNSAVAETPCLICKCA